MRKNIILSITIVLSSITPTDSFAIVNPDRELRESEASFTASLDFFDGEEYKSFCSGTLITPQIILTAAHCIVDYDQETAQTWSAYFKLVANSNTEVLRVNIVSAIFHQKYEDSLSTIQINPDGSEIVLKEGYVAPGTSEYDADIALLLLEKPVTLIKPATMARTSTRLAPNWRVYGWGAVSSDLVGVGTNLRTTSVDDATTEMSEYLNDPMDNIYAAYSVDATNNVRTTCYGDSGGPLVDGKGVIIGITSFAMVETCEEIAPTVYTKVASYRTWIYKNSSTLVNRYLRLTKTAKIIPTTVNSTTEDGMRYPVTVYGRW